jgi:nitrogen fixation protein NifU and related proteins
MDPELKREIILDNYSNPFHKETKKDGYLTANSNNASCIDNINIFIKIENDKVVDAYFDGEACAISTASTSIMLRKIIGMSVEEAQEFITNFENMINEKEYDKSSLGEAIVFDEIYKQESRKTCATLSYRGLDKILNEKSLKK